MSESTAMNEKLPQELVIASGNMGKLKEFQALLAPTGIRVRPQSEWQVPDADETGLTFIENAILKARHAARLTGLPALADDSGLAVTALGGAPGIYSARYAGEHGDHQANIAKLLAALTNETERAASFHCVLALLQHPEDPTPLICHGRWDGSIALQAAGNGGFGYDPVFWVPEYECTAAQLPAQQKADISHRGQALRLLLEQLR